MLTQREKLGVDTEGKVRFCNEKALSGDCNKKPYDAEAARSYNVVNFILIFFLRLSAYTKD